MYLVYTSKIKALEVMKKLDVKMFFHPLLKACTFVLYSVIFIFLCTKKHLNCSFRVRQSTEMAAHYEIGENRIGDDVFNARKKLINLDQILETKYVQKM